MYAIRQAYPDARLTVLTAPGRRGAPGATDVLASIGWIDEIIAYYNEDLGEFKAVFKLLARVRQLRFDVFIELSNDLARGRALLRNMLFARLSGVRWGGGWSLNTLRLGVQAQSEGIDFPNETERLLDDLAGCGIATPDLNYRAPADQTAARAAMVLMNGAGVLPEKQIVALAPGAKRTTNRWFPERFASVGMALAKEGYEVLVLGSEGEREIAEQVCRIAGGGFANLVGMTDVATASEILRRCRLLICNDSGLQHTASAVGTPCVAIFSARDISGKWRPHHPDSTMLRRNVPCHTCYLEQCPNGNLCLSEIGAAEVTEAARAVLGSCSGD
jgi:ADP-heptose:LPS heptosyltransferase